MQTKDNQLELFTQDRVDPVFYKWVGREWGEALEHELTHKLPKVLFQLRTLKETSVIYPEPSLVFNAYLSTPLSKVKVLLLGQDPYHDGSAHGLSFSTLGKVTPSLRVIFKELANCGFIRTQPNLSDWASQGVLLLNTVLTVSKGLPNSHRGLGWQDITKATIRAVVRSPSPVIFLLWGKEAQNTYDSSLVPSEPSLYRDKLALRLPHPQAENYSGGKSGFLNSQCFITVNSFLNQHELEEIHWGDPKV